MPKRTPKKWVPGTMPYDSGIPDYRPPVWQHTVVPLPPTIIPPRVRPMAHKIPHDKGGEVITPVIEPPNPFSTPMQRMR